MRITVLRPQPRRPDRVEVHLDGAPYGTLAAEIVVAAGLRQGDDLPAGALAELASRDEAWRARAAALRLLSARARSASELLRSLLRRGFPAPVAEEAVRRVTETGLVDDAAFAEGLVRGRARSRPAGKRRLQQELRRRGVDPATARTAVDEVLRDEGTTELELARRAAEKWRPRAGEDAHSARRRLYGFLARRGFGADAVRAAMAERLGEGGSG